MNAQLAPVIDDSGIAAYTATEQGLAELRARLTGRVYDVTTGKGMDEARKDRAECRSLRVDLEAKRKEIKAPALDYCRRIDSEAKRITTEIEGMEDPIDQQIKAEEARKEAARAERERAEAERLAGINAQIDRVRNMPILYVTATPAVISEAIAELQSMDLDALFDEVHRPRAVEAQQGALDTLTALHTERVTAIAEAARLAAERAELERQQAEAKEAQRIADDAASAARAEADRAAQAERDRLDAIARQEQAAREKELEAREAAVRAEQERIEAATRAEREQQEREMAERASALRAEQEAFADAQRAAAEAAEAAYIAQATLRDAAKAAHAVLTTMAPDHLATRALGAALERDQ